MKNQEFNQMLDLAREVELMLLDHIFRIYLYYGYYQDFNNSAYQDACKYIAKELFGGNLLFGNKVVKAAKLKLSVIVKFEETYIARLMDLNEKLFNKACDINRLSSEIVDKKLNKYAKIVLEIQRLYEYWISLILVDIYGNSHAPIYALKFGNLDSYFRSCDESTIKILNWADGIKNRVEMEADELNAEKNKLINDFFKEDESFLEDRVKEIVLRIKDDMESFKSRLSSDEVKELERLKELRI